MPPAFSEPHKLKQTRVCLTPFTRLTPTGFAAHLIVEQIACPPLPPCGQQIMFSTRTTKIPLLLPPALYDRRFFFVILGFETNFQDNGLNALAGVVSLCPAVTGDLFLVEGGNVRLSEVRTGAAQSLICSRRYNVRSRLRRRDHLGW